MNKSKITNQISRKYFIDNLRSFCILLLVPFHAAIAWNCWGEQNYVWFSESKIASSFVIFISPWYMALLFVLAGCSLFYSLKKRTVSQVLKERFKKLLLPLILGVVFVVPIMCYFADRFHNNFLGNFFEHYKIFFTKFTDLTGYDGGFTPGHLWFLFYLFVISLFSVGIITLQRFCFSKMNFVHFDFLNRLTTKWKILLLYASGILPAIMTPILNINGKSIGAYTALFLLGFYLISKDNVIELIKKIRFFNLILFLIFNILDVYFFIWCKDKSAVIAVLNTIAMHFTCWFGILTLLGFGYAYFNKRNKVTAYLSSKSFLFYIFHFNWVVVLQFYAAKILSNGLLIFTISIVGSYILTFWVVEFFIGIIEKLTKIS